MAYIVLFIYKIINLIKTLPPKTVQNIKYSRQELTIFVLYKIAILLIENTILLLKHFHCYLPGDTNTFDLCRNIQACNQRIIV